MVHTTAYCGSLERACLKEGIPISIWGRDLPHQLPEGTLRNHVVQRDRMLQGGLVMRRAGRRRALGY